MRDVRFSYHEPCVRLPRMGAQLQQQQQQQQQQLPQQQQHQQQQQPTLSPLRLAWDHALCLGCFQAEGMPQPVRPAAEVVRERQTAMRGGPGGRGGSKGAGGEVAAGGAGWAAPGTEAELDRSACLLHQKLQVRKRDGLHALPKAPVRMCYTLHSGQGCCTLHSGQGYTCYIIIILFPIVPPLLGCNIVHPSAEHVAAILTIILRVTSLSSSHTSRSWTLVLPAAWPCSTCCIQLCSSSSSSSSSSS